VAAAGQARQHRERVVRILGLPEDRSLDRDGRVGRQDERGLSAGKEQRGGRGLRLREPEDVGLGALSRLLSLVHPGDDDVEGEAQARQQRLAARRCGGEHERRQRHGPPIISRTRTEEAADEDPGPPDDPPARLRNARGAVSGAASLPEVPLSLNLPEGALVAPGPAPDLELLYTGDVIGYLEDCGCKVNPAGGLARRAWLVNQLRTNYPETPLVLLDAGNFSDNPTEKGDIRTAALLKEMVNLGYKAVSVGDRDLTMGYDDLMKRIQGLPMQFISTNIVTQGTTDPVFPPYALVEVKGKDGKLIRIGVLAVIRYTPVWQKSGPKGTNLAAAPVVEMVRRYYPEVRAKSDLVVLLASLAKDDVREIATQLPELDMVIGSYGGIYSDKEERAGKVAIYYTGNQGKRIGESRITLDAARHASDIRSYVHFLTANYPSDRQMADRIAALAPAKPAAEEKDTQPHPAKLILKPN
jgi:hypothetical protein